jgi:PAP2 superfamily
METGKYFNAMLIGTIAVLMFFTTYRLRLNEQKRNLAPRFIVEACIILIFSTDTSYLLTFVSKLTPLVYDQDIYKIEAVTGISFPWLVEIFSGITSYFVMPFSLIYNFLVYFIILAASSEILYSETSAKNNLIARFTIGAVLSIPLYYVLPAVGPNWFFHDVFPYHMPDAASISAWPAMFNDGGSVARNAMPSLHATWTILCLLALRNSPVWHRILGVAYVSVTLISTLGSGYHYFLDWIVAFPLVLLIRSVASDIRLLSVRGVSFLTSSVLLGAWITVIRCGDIFVSFPKALDLLIALTIVVPAVLETTLFKRECVQTYGARPVPSAVRKLVEARHSPPVASRSS